MNHGSGHIVEVRLDQCFRIACQPGLVPAPGKYTLANAPGMDEVLPVPLFFCAAAQDGFWGAPPMPAHWAPGSRLALRGPHGHGFQIGHSVRKLLLLALEGDAGRLLGLIPIALQQGAGVVLVTDQAPHNLPEDVEVLPLRALGDACPWADGIAVDVARENLAHLAEIIPRACQAQTQVLVRAPMPCGGVADCGICATSSRRDWQMICRDGPVFPFTALMPSAL